MRKVFFRDLLPVCVVVALMVFITVRYASAQETHNELDIRACLLDMRKEYLDRYMEYVEVVEEYYLMWSDVITEYVDVAETFRAMRLSYYDISTDFEPACIHYEWVASYGVSSKYLDKYTLALNELYAHLPDAGHYVSLHKDGLDKIEVEIDQMGSELLTYGLILDKIHAGAIPDDNMAIGGNLEFEHLLSAVEEGRLDIKELLNLGWNMFNNYIDDLSKLRDTLKKINNLR